MSDAFSVLILGPDPHEAAELAAQLEAGGDFVARPAADAPYFERPLDAERVDAILALSHVSETQLNAIISTGYRGLLIGLGTEMPVVSETIAVPVKVSNLIARLKQQIRHFYARDDAWLTIGSFRLFPGSRKLLAPDGAEHRLTDKEVDILRFMHRAGGALVSRDQLLSGVWGYNDRVTTHTLETHIYRLRQKIEADPNAAMILMTESGGYRLSEPIEETK
jgi:DNA-binding winged helix-turn-helix (wHTH) protein